MIRDYFIGFIVFISLVFVEEAKGQTESNDTGILTDLWSSLTSIGKVPTCPGECVHAITSIFCDNVLEEITCGATFLRCCVPHELSFGTPVETSAPVIPIGHLPNVHSDIQNDTQTTQSTISFSSTTAKPTTHSITSHPLMIRPHNPKPYIPSMVFGSLNINSFDKTKSSPSTAASTTTTITSTTSTSSSSTTTTTTTPRPTSVPNISPKTPVDIESTTVSKGLNPSFESCPGICIQEKYVRYCGNILSNGKCSNKEDHCCLQSEIDFDNSSSIVTVVQQSDALNDSKVDQIIPEIFNQSGPTLMSTPLPLCEGTCVAPLFSLLCDETDYNLYCPNGGSCCVNKEPTTEAPPPIKPCPGTCIPMILSGMCNRPSELILKTTNCNSGSICCHNPKSENNEDVIKDLQIEESDPSNGMPIIPQTNTQNYRPIVLPQMPNNPMPSGIYGSETPLSHVALGQLPLIPPQIPSALKPPQLLPPSIPKQELPPEISSPIPERDPNDDDSSEDNKSVVIRPPGGPPFCPGPCIAPMFRFTCFGGNSIYPKFQCAKGGHICCASMSDIQAFEASVLANNGVWKTNTSKTTVYDDSPIKPPPPKRPNPYMCGIKGTQRKETPRILGVDSFHGEWCWQVALINSQNQYLCGGALIGAQWVLTAAHCITNLVRNGDAIYVRVGDYDLTSQLGSRGAQTQRVSTTYIHHNHNGQTLDNDIALLKLQSPVELNEAVCLVCLPARGSKRKPGKKCTVTGYGYKEESGPIALKVREATVPVVDDQECTVKINSVTEKLFILPASSFCAGGDEGNDACQGDGGSGLTCEVDGYYELTGLVSWGFGCGRTGVPGVYVKVSAFVGWINQIISVNNQ